MFLSGAPSPSSMLPPEALCQSALVELHTVENHLYLLTTAKLLLS